MFNKILLACLGGGSTPNELVFRLKITVGTNGSNIGYSMSLFGDCEVLEAKNANDTIAYLMTSMPYTIFGNLIDYGRVRIVNTTTGKTSTSLLVTTSGGVSSYYIPVDLFDGVEIGQECIFEVYV